MNKITKKMLTAILSVTFSLVALGTVTFAWITLTNTATLLPIDLDVSTYGGIEISLGNLDEMSNAFYGYFTDVKKANIVTFLKSKGYDVTDEKNFELKQVTYNGDKFYDMDGNEIEDNISGGYMTFDLTLRSQIANQYVYLTPNTSLTSTRKTWKADAEFVNAHGVHIMPGHEIPYSLANSARMSFTADEQGETGKDFIYERPSYAMESAISDLGYLLSDIYYGNANHTDGFEIGGGGAIAYYNAKHEDQKNQVDLPETKSTFIGAKPIAYFDEEIEPDSDGFYYATVTVNIWLEGWDADSINAALGETLKVNIQFTTDEPTGYTETVKVQDESDLQFTIARETFKKEDEIVSSNLLNDFDAFNIVDRERKLSGVVGNLSEDTLELYITIEMFQIVFNFEYDIEVEPELEEPDPIVRKLMLEGDKFNLPNAPIVKGYTFVWEDEVSKQVITNLNSIMPENNLVLNGKYVPNEYKIIFNNSDLYQITIVFGKKINFPDDPNKDGSTFVGWFTDAAYTKKFEVPDTMPANDIILYAKWFTPEED